MLGGFTAGRGGTLAFCMAADDDGSLEPLPAVVGDTAHSSAFRITSVIDVALSGLSLLLLLCGWVYVVVHRHRALCALRIALGLTATLWVLGVVASHGAIWSLVEQLVGSSQQPGSRRWDREQLCGIHAAVTLGFSEPASLLLIASLIRAKTLPRRAAHPSWRLMRRSLGLAVLLASLQALAVGLPLSGAWRHSVVLEPLPPVLNASDGAALGREVWWRDEEGCANSAATVGVCSLFVVPFELYWTLTCYRLLGLIINLRLKARLYCVQLTYTLVPALLLLLRIALLVYATNWTIGRRLMRDAELVLVLLAGVIAARSLIWRPVHENVIAAPLASIDAAAPEEELDLPLHAPPSRHSSHGGSRRLKRVTLSASNLLSLSSSLPAPPPPALGQAAKGKPRAIILGIIPGTPCTSPATKTKARRDGSFCHLGSSTSTHLASSSIYSVPQQ